MEQHDWLNAEVVRWITATWRFLGLKDREHPPVDQFDVHTAIVCGQLSTRTLGLFFSKVRPMAESDLLMALGMSRHTLRRNLSGPQRALGPALADRLWSLGEVVVQAEQVFLDLQRASEWMSRPALGLSARRPIELMQTQQGRALVKDFLIRLEYSVYS